MEFILIDIVLFKDMVSATDMSKTGRYLLSSMDHDRLIRLVGNNFAYHALTVTLPRSDAHTENWKSSDYEILNLSLVDILEPKFINKIKRGKINDSSSLGTLVAISKDRRIDTDNVFIITQSGYLILHVTNETYQKLGLVGKRSKNSKKTSIIKYVIEINLLNLSDKVHNRIKWSFENILPSKVEFYMVDSSTQSPTAKSCKLDIAEKCKIVTPDLLNLNFKDNQFAEEELLDIFEWMGLVLCDSKCIKDGSDIDPFISVYSPPQNSTLADISVTTLRGMIHPIRAVDIVKQILETKNNSWFLISLSGFRDAPITWNHQEHGYLFSGENDLLVFGNQNGIMTAQIVGSQDKDLKF